MTPAQLATTKKKIDDIFNATLGSGSKLSTSLAGVVASKLYEARVLAELLEKLHGSGYGFSVQNGSAGLKASPGPINSTYAHIQVMEGAIHRANIWTDIEFVGLSSYRLANHPAPMGSGEYHELDVAVCDPIATGRPNSDKVYVGVEAKHWAHIPKKLLREVLGVRRELSFSGSSPRGSFNNPNLSSTTLRRLMHATPPSQMIFAYSTAYPVGAGPIVEWSTPSLHFDIEIWNITV